MAQDIQYTLILESIAEMNARLRILDETNARLEAAVERQQELLELLATNQSQMLRALQQPQVAAKSTDDMMPLITARRSP